MKRDIFENAHGHFLCDVVACGKIMALLLVFDERLRLHRILIQKDCTHCNHLLYCQFIRSDA